MKMSSISLGVAATFCAFSPAAHALLASNYTNSGEYTGTTENIRISGTPVADNVLLSSVLRMCLAGSLTRYGIANNAVYFCAIDSARLTPRSGATRLAVYKYSTGGSASGISPVNNSSQVPFLDLSKLAASCAGLSTAVALNPADPLSPTFQDIACAGASNSLVTNAVPYIGLSDLEPAFFGSPSTYANLAPPIGLASAIVGVTVTKNVYEYLQTLQGLSVGSLTDANHPRLTGRQLQRIFTETGVTWADLTSVPFSALDDEVFVARRTDASGVQKTFEARIARTPNGTLGAKSCHIGLPPFRNGPTANDNTAANSLCDGSNLEVNGAATSQVVTCLTRLQSQGLGGVGVMTTADVVEVSSGAWRFVKINGDSPTWPSVAAGSNTAYADVSLNTRLYGSSTTNSQPGYADFLTRMKQEFGNPANYDGWDPTNPFGRAGLMALDALAVPVPAPDYSGTTPRNPWSRMVGGTTLNNCL